MTTIIPTVFKGTELKYKLEIECEGFSMDDDDFKVELYNSRVHQEIAKDELYVEQGEENEYYFHFDSAEFGTGEVTLKVTAYVPDYAFPDSLRTEVYKQILVKVIN